METKELRRLEVDDLDDEIYYREKLGCTANVEPSGKCATVSCSDGDVRICQRPGGDEGRVAQADSGCGAGCEDAC